MRRWLPLFLLAWPVLGVAEAAITIHDVTIRDFAFDPATITVAPGDTVRWTNQGQQPHSFTFSDSSTDVLPATSQTKSFSTPGTYAYHCRFHASMQGTVVVQAASSSSTSSTTTTTLRRTVSTTTTTTTAPLASSITAPPDSTTTTIDTAAATDESTTTIAEEAVRGATRVTDNRSSDDDNVDVPGAIAALLLLLTAGGALLQTRGGFR